MANTNQKEIHLILGPPLTGKTTFIKENYNDQDKFYVINYADKFFELFSSYDDIEDSNKLTDAYNEIALELADNFRFDNKILVIEYCTGFEEGDKDLNNLIKQMKSINVEVKVKQISLELEESKKLQELAKQDPSYFSSYHLNEHHYLLLNHFFSDMGAPLIDN